MALSLKAHNQALYTAMRAGLDTDGHTAKPLFHVFSGDSQTGAPAQPPFVVYRQEWERTLGTTTGGASRVMRSGWIITAYSKSMAESLALASSCANALVDASLTTTDGYTTTNLSILGVQSLFEPDGRVHATHVRFEWERSS